MDDKPQQARQQRYLARVIVLLLLIAFAATAARFVLQREDGWPVGDRLLNVKLDASVRVIEKSSRLSISPPWDTNYVRLFGQSLSHPGYRMSRDKQNKAVREIVLLATNSGEHRLQLSFEFHQGTVPRTLKSKPLDEAGQALWLSLSDAADDLVVRKIVDLASEDSPERDTLVKRLYQHVSDNIRVVNKASDDALVALKQGKASRRGMHEALVLLLRVAHLPARLVTGIDLDRAGTQQPVRWVEAYVDQRWQPMDVVRGHRDALPATYVPFNRGADSILVTDDNAWVTGLDWRIEAASPRRGVISGEDPGPLSVFDLTRLSPSTRTVIGLLMLLPFGVLCTEALRQLLGMRTYGTFTPTLLALAAVYVDAKTAAIVFTLVVSFGIAGRSLLPGLKLSRVPRLSVIFIMVAMAMTLVVSMLIYFDSTTDSAVVLLPIVILTTLVDRIYTTADKYGTRLALRRLLWTALAALLSMLVLLQPQLGEFMLVWPELHAITLAAVILLGPCRDWCKQNLAWFNAIQIDSEDDKTVS